MDYLSGWCKSERRLDSFTAIVTGANGGMGKEITLELYKRGARVIMGCRDLIRAEAVKLEIIEEALNHTHTGTLVVEELDLCRLNSVREFVRRFLGTEKTLHILINNAGVMCCPKGKTEEGFETHVGVNHFGHALLTLLLLPRLIKSAPSRIIFVSSAIHYFCNIDFEDINYEHTRYNALEAYSRSKMANMLFAKALAQKLKENEVTGVTTYSVHPGIVLTKIDRHFWPWLSYCFHLNLLRWMWKSPRCGAQTIIYCAVDDSCADETGLYYTQCAPCPPSSYGRKNEVITRLWDLTITMLHLHHYDPFHVPTDTN